LHRGHEPGCSLQAVLSGQRPYRLVRLQEVYGDAAYGYDGRDRKRLATEVAPTDGYTPPAFHGEHPIA
jgi:hypothetical protein